MAINTEEAYQRYYLFRHKGDVFEWYCGYILGWMKAKSECYLSGTKERLVSIANDHMPSDFTYVIGRVDVIVDGKFCLEVVSENRE